MSSSPTCVCSFGIGWQIAGYTDQLRARRSLLISV